METLEEKRKAKAAVYYEHKKKLLVGLPQSYCHSTLLSNLWETVLLVLCASVRDRMCVHCCSLRSPVRKEPPGQWAAITYGEHETRCKRRNLIFSYELGASTDINDGLFLSTETATESRKGQGTGAEVCE